MSDQHGENQWQGASARSIMKEARRRFAESYRNLGTPNASAHTAFASAHYSVVKQHMSPKWKVPLAIWHMRRAVVHVKKAARLEPASYAEMLVIAEILTRTPRLLGGDPRRAADIIENCFGYSRNAANEMAEMIPHDKALFHIALAQAYEKAGAPFQDVRRQYEYAVDERYAIEDELDSLMAQRQWVRIAFAAGVWFFRNKQFTLGQSLVYEARELAEQVSKDQLKNKIEPWMWQHGLVAY